MPRKIKRKTSGSRKANFRGKKGISVFRFISIFILIGAGVFYLMQVGKISVTAYEANDLKRQIKELESEKKILELEAVKLQSMASINKRLNDLKMVAVEKLEYIGNDKAVAVK